MIETNIVNTKSNFHLKGLDSLRFLGSFVVLFHHIESRKMLLGFPSLKKYLTLSGLGNASMTLFFVLSGFLITYLLLNEKKQTKQINIKGFYLRRILRIWPVYYFLLLLGISLFTYTKWFQVPQTLSSIKGDYYSIIVLYLFHLSNFQMFFTSRIKSLMHYWSMGVEEQFYIFWPWLVKKTNRYLKIFTTVIIIKLVLKVIVVLSYTILPMSEESIAFLKKVEHFLFLLRFESFAVGGIAAYLLVEKKEKILDYIYKPVFQRINICMLLLSMPLGHITDSIHIFYAVSFAVIILNAVNNPKTVFCLDNTYTNYLGKISYGIYMYQFPLLVLVINIFKPYYTSTHWLMWHAAVNICCIAITLIVSIVSYELIEKKIISFGKRITLSNPSK